MKSKKEFEKKYREVIFTITKANDVDLSVGYNMLISSIKGYAGMTYMGGGERKLYDEYAGIPENFNYSECLSDWFSLVRV